MSEYITFAAVEPLAFMQIFLCDKVFGFDVFLSVFYQVLYDFFSLFYVEMCKVNVRMELWCIERKFFFTTLHTIRKKMLNSLNSHERIIAGVRMLAFHFKTFFSSFQTHYTFQSERQTKTCIFFLFEWKLLQRNQMNTVFLHEKGGNHLNKVSFQPWNVIFEAREWKNRSIGVKAREEIFFSFFFVFRIQFWFFFYWNQNEESFWTYKALKKKFIH